MSFEYDYSTQTMPDKMRRLAAYHAATATDINKVHPGWTPESSFHWEGAIDLVVMANHFEAFQKEIKELQAKNRLLNRDVPTGKRA